MAEVMGVAVMAATWEVLVALVMAAAVMTVVAWIEPPKAATLKMVVVVQAVAQAMEETEGATSVARPRAGMARLRLGVATVGVASEAAAEAAGSAAASAAARAAGGRRRAAR